MCSRLLNNRLLNYRLLNNRLFNFRFRLCLGLDRLKIGILLLALLLGRSKVAGIFK